MEDCEITGCGDDGLCAEGTATVRGSLNVKGNQDGVVAMGSEGLVKFAHDDHESSGRVDLSENKRDGLGTFGGGTIEYIGVSPRPHGHSQ